MEKRLVILFLLLITGCQKNNEVACSYIIDEKQVVLDIKAINDDICSIHERTVFVIPNTIMADEEKLIFLNKQLDSNYYFEDNLLIKEEDLDIDNVYSLRKTLEYLKTKRFICE